MDRHVPEDYDFVAVLDSDQVFHSFGVEDIIFDWSDPERPKPVWHGDLNPLSGDFRGPVQLLFGGNWIAEFSQSWPNLLHRRDLAYCREYLLERIRGLLGDGLPSNASLLEAWMAFEASHGQISTPPALWAHCVWFSSGRKDDYAWSFHGSLTPAHLHANVFAFSPGDFSRYTCPWPRSVTHVPFMGQMLFLEDYEVIVKYGSGRNLQGTGAATYPARAGALMAAGLCGVKWRVPREQNEMASWLRSRAQDCARPRYNLSRMILARHYPTGLWTEAESMHCGPRHVSRLLRTYHALLDGIVFLSHPRRPRGS
mmetsp:Transcript_1082/g.3163  ORF Transcript_1082/g.3163 Transcript_1082/m.3163 type:complete len:312 (-) Transcript_1082:72-1007(-)